MKALKELLTFLHANTLKSLWVFINYAIDVLGYVFYILLFN